MRRRIIASIAAFLCLAVGYADNIMVDDVALRPGDTNELTISLESAMNGAVGMQFDLKLPDGCSLVPFNGKVYQLSSGQASDLTCNVSERGDNAYRFVLYSGTLQRLKAGGLMSLNLKASNSLAMGSYSVQLSNVAFSDIDGRVTKVDGANANVIVTNFFPSSQNIKVEDATINAGESAPLSIFLLESISGCVGIQFDLVLPEGFFLEKGADGKEYELSALQADDISCSMKAVGGGVYRFVLYSNALNEFVSSRLMDICLRVNSEKSSGTYPLEIRNVILSDVAGNVYKDIGTEANLKVTKIESEVTSGDINGNGEVDDEDVDAFIELYLEDEIPEPGDPDFKNFDANGDGIITLADAVAIFYLSNGLNFDGTDPAAATVRHGLTRSHGRLRQCIMKNG